MCPLPLWNILRVFGARVPQFETGYATLVCAPEMPFQRYHGFFCRQSVFSALCEVTGHDFTHCITVCVHRRADYDKLWENVYFSDSFFSLSWFLYDYLYCLYYILNHHVRVIDFKILYFSQKVNRLFITYCMVLCCFFTEMIKRFQTYHPILQIKIKLTTSNEKSDPVRQVFQFQGP